MVITVIISRAPILSSGALEIQCRSTSIASYNITSIKHNTNRILTTTTYIAGIGIAGYGSSATDETAGKSSQVKSSLVKSSQV